jgi:Zn-dependent protease with chaperone function
MNLEPRVLNTIRRKKLRQRVQEAAIYATLVALTAAVLALIIIPFAAGNTSFSPFVRKSGLSGLITVSIVFAGAIGAAGVALFLVSHFRDRDYYAGFTRKAGRYDLKQLARFLNALEGAASKAGVDAPHVTVLDSSVPNAVAFGGREDASIGVTSAALDSSLEYAEMEAVLAHELASVIAGDYLRRPGARTFDIVSLAMLWVLAMVSLVAIPIVRHGHSALVSLGVVVVVLAYLVLLSLWMRYLTRSREHDYVLADSVAVKMTGNPEAMRSAISKMDGLVNAGRGKPFPESEIGLKYLFAPPHKWSEDSMAFLKRRAVELDYNMKEAAAQRRVANLQESMDELSEWGKDLLAERLENISEIEEGSWRAW